MSFLVRDIQDSTSPDFPDFGALRSSGLPLDDGVGLKVESVESFRRLELGSKACELSEGADV